MPENPAYDDDVDRLSIQPRGSQEYFRFFELPWNAHTTLQNEKLIICLLCRLLLAALIGVFTATRSRPIWNASAFSRRQGLEIP